MQHERDSEIQTFHAYCFTVRPTFPLAITTSKHSSIYSVQTSLELLLCYLSDKQTFNMNESSVQPDLWG